MRISPATADEFEGLELEQYETAVRYLGTALVASGEGSAEDVPYAAGALVLLRKSPAHALALWTMGSAMDKQYGKPGTWTPYEHEFIDEVLAFDAGHYALLDLHVPLAVAAGIRVEAIEAIRDRRDDDLEPAERTLVDFIRGVRDGTLSQEVFEQVRDRLGSERGVVEYAVFVMTLVTHTRLMQAFDTPSPTLDEINALLAGLQSGQIKPPSVERYAEALKVREG